MPFEIILCPQGSPEWYAARRGMPTASEFHHVLARGEGKTRGQYMRKLAGEIITGRTMENYTNGQMERGKLEEDGARRTYALQALEPVAQVGFVKNDAIGAGCSPDALVGADGVLEIKSAAPHVLIEKLFKGPHLPPEHTAQCQGALWVTERRWCDLVIYSPDMPLFVHRVQRNEIYIKTLATEVTHFREELQVMVNKLRRMM